MRRVATMTLLLLLASCAPFRAVCLLPSQRPMTVTELFFGRDIAGRGPLTDEEWSDFAGRYITPEFPEGFTVTDGEGDWRNPGTGITIRERTKILIVAAPPSPDLASRISTVREAYSRLYHQTSVGVLTYEACGAF